MAIRYGPQLEAELDEIWIYIAQESGSIDVADRLVDSITDHFPLLSKNPQLGRRRDHNLRPGLRSRR
jgi:plasmid stabilization system protein ParE